MADNKMKPLCMRTETKPATYICTVTGNNCKIVTDNLRQLQETIEQSKKDGRIFITKESNLCEEHNCPIWNNTMLKIAEYAKQYSRGK